MIPEIDLDRLYSTVSGWSTTEVAGAHERLLRGPPLFDIEAASVCNARCVFCPREASSGRPPIMSPGTFEDVLAFLPDDAVVMFSGFGEPLLNPHLEEYACALKSRGISPCVITNGLLLSPERQTSLIAAGMDQFQVSIHAARPDTWRKMAGIDGGYDRVMANLEHLGHHRPEGFRVNLNYVESPENVSEEPEVEELARRMGFRFYARRVHARAGEVGEPRAKRISGCGIFASVTFIDVAGDIGACVNDVRGTTRLGSVRSLTWAEAVVWKQERLREMGLFPVCARCDDDYRFVILGQEGVDV